ncbi:MAG TPA: aminotransferase class I/II-fold pyridoxal phosphate-dependent enzyme [Polyangiaceae bacterium]|nr:aminotransferase class I/II-fold pyridoxal phosphate-dependent enzyme [Polyangiaceae bacterium]
MSQKILEALKAQGPELDRRYQAVKEKKLNLDMTRGKPCSEQLDLANGLISNLGPNEYKAEDGTDCRNYGGVDGLPEAKRLFSEFLEVAPSEILIGDNSSLALMYECVALGLSHGVPGGAGPWSREKPKFLCPAPGYDRHFAICEHFGIEMISVDMTPDGPDMDKVEALVAEDASIKGIWIVPKYQNPTGITCSPRTVGRLSKMKTKAPDFRIFWDNAYAHHHLTDSPPRLENLLSAAKAEGNGDRVLVFGSTSKVSWAGSGVAMVGATEKNVGWLRGHRGKATIGPDKVSQLRHVKFFKDMDGVRAHMKKHQDILKPKFDKVIEIFEREMGGKGIATWTKPLGGYFISLDTLDGCAKAVVKMAADVGVKLTEAGGTHPYGKDPRDRNIRIAPSLPKLPEIEVAMEVVALCVARASLAKLSG